MTRPRLTNGRIQVLIGISLLAGLSMQVQRAIHARAGRSEPAVGLPQLASVSGAAFAALPKERATGASLEDQAARDPLAFIQMALDRYDRSVRDYTCTFSKQERIGGQLTPDQLIAVYFREKPLSVRMEWRKNPDRVARVLYIADKWIENGQRMALVEPASSIAQLFVSYVMRPIHGEEARKNSRKSIDQFGLRSTMALTLKFARLSQDQHALDFSYKGVSQVGGRPTLVFERRLPYTGEDGPWPDRVQVLHMDRELLLPVLSASYADDERQILLGRYQCTDIKLNPNLSDSVFTKEGMGF